MNKEQMNKNGSFAKSFGITFRPKNGMTDKCEEALIKWLGKQDGAHAVSEMKESARHIHAQVWIKEGRMKGEISTAMARIGERTIDGWDSTQKRYGICIKICYNDWYNNYTLDNEDKSEEPEVIYDNVPDITHDFYPTEEEQESLKNKVNAVDKGMYNLEMMYFETHSAEEKVNIKDIQAFMADMMYNSRRIQVIVDRKRLNDMCRGLTHYINKETRWQACATINEINEDIDFQRRKEEFERSCEEARLSEE